MSNDLNDKIPVNPFETSVFSGMGLDNDFDRNRFDSDPGIDISSIKEVALDGFQIPVESDYFHDTDEISVFSIESEQAQTIVEPFIMDPVESEIEETPDSCELTSDVDVSMDTLHGSN